MPQRPIRVALVSVQRPLFRGDKAGIWAASIEGLSALATWMGAELEVIAEPVTNGEEAQAAGRALVESSADFVLVQATTFATADCFEPLLSTGRPSGVWAVPEPELGGPLPLNSLCGANFVSSLNRGGGRAKWFYGEVSDPRFAERFVATLRALRALRRVATARVLWLGGTAPTFRRFEVTADAVLARFGATVEPMPLERLFDRLARVRDEEALGAARDMTDGAVECHLNPEQLVAAGRLDVALHTLVDEGGYDAVALRCWPECPDRAGAMPCASVGRLFDRGCPTACEGDVLGALSLLALDALGQGGSVLLDLSHVTPEHVIFWHCGNGPSALAADGWTSLEPHFNRTELGAVRTMRLAPGAATMLRFTGTEHAALFEGEWFDQPQAFDGVSGWFGNIRWNGSRPLAARDLVATVLDRGLPHHYAFSPGRWSAAASELCSWLGLRLVKPTGWQTALHAESAEEDDDA